MQKYERILLTIIPCGAGRTVREARGGGGRAAGAG